MPDRRAVLRRTGSIVLGSTLLTGPAAARRSTSDDDNEEGERFIVDTGNRVSRRDRREAEDNGLEIINRIDPVGIMTLQGKRKDIKNTSYDFAPDLHFQVDPPQAKQGRPETVDETRFPLQWDKQVQDIAEVHYETRGEGTRVAVLDTGILETHPDLEGPLNVNASRNFTSDGGDHNPGSNDHGTHVAGIIAADDQNGVEGTEGVVGSAPGAELVDCRVFPRGEEVASFGDILAAMAYSGGLSVSVAGPEGETNAVEMEAADVANMSLGSLVEDPPYEVRLFLHTVLDEVARRVLRNGTLLVASAGNNGTDLTGRTLHIPSASNYVMSVSATGPVGFGWPINDQDGSGSWNGINELEDPIELEEEYTEPAIYTNYGLPVDIAGPGGNVDLAAMEADKPGWYLDLVHNCTFDGAYSDGADPSYGWKAGTSMSAPNVAGTAALVRSQAPDLSPQGIKTVLKATADRVDDLSRRNHGSGFVDPVAAVRRVA